MSSITATIHTTKVEVLEGLSAAEFKVSVFRSDLTDEPKSAIVAADQPLDVRFDGLTPGEYVVVASRVDQFGRDIYDPVSTMFTIDAPVADPAGAAAATLGERPRNYADVPESISVVVHLGAIGST